MATLTQQQVDTLRYVCDLTETELRAYSGRAMYGEVCLGIVIDGAGDLFALALEIQRQDPALAVLLVNQCCRTDSMGSREIVYWQYVKTVGTDLDDNEEED